MNRKKDFDQVIAYYLRARELVAVDVCAARLRGGTDFCPLVVSAAFVLGGVACHRDTSIGSCIATELAYVDRHL